MHGIQTSGNDIRNITCDALEGIAEDGIVDTRPFAEITRQWSSLHPEFSYLPRKFKIAFNGAEEDRAAIGWYDIGLQARRAEDGSVGFTMKVGGGMGRTTATAGATTSGRHASRSSSRAKARSSLTRSRRNTRTSSSLTALPTPLPRPNWSA